MLKKTGIISLTLLLCLISLISLPSLAARVHRVQSGESLISIANQYQVTTGELIWLNHLQNPDNIFLHQVLIIPDTEGYGLYRVQPGDTLFHISQKLGVPVRILAAGNYITDLNNLQVYQPLYIPSRYLSPEIYTVKGGDTLIGIAASFSVGLDEVLLLNDLGPDSLIVEGQKLKIPAVKRNPGSGSGGYNGPDYSSQFSDMFFLRGRTDERKIALTFDDGPDEIYTPAILDVLQELHVPAAFFVVGSKAAEDPEVVQRIVNEGHLLASHTWSHMDLSQAADQRFTSEVKQTEELLSSYTELKPLLIRPPYGAVNARVLNKLDAMGYKVVDWSVDSRDWKVMDVDQILINTLPNVNKGSIILLHSAGGTGEDLTPTVKVLPELIQTLRMEGFTFVRLDQLLGL